MDFQPLLIRAAEIRHQHAVENQNRNQFAWKVALAKLRDLRHKITVFKSGPQKGDPKGIPKDIVGEVRSTLYKIVWGLEEVDLPLKTRTRTPKKRAVKTGQILAENNNNIPDEFALIKKESVFRLRKPGDGMSAILAAMYSLTRDEESYIFGERIRTEARNYTDHPIQYNHRTGTYGVWKGIKTIIAHGFIRRAVENSSHKYRLTKAGRQFCYLLFNEKLHPSRDPNCRLVVPGCLIQRDGSIGGVNGAAAAYHENRNDNINMGR